MLESAELARAISDVRTRIERACRRAGRRPEEVRLVAVTKTVSSERVGAAAAAGIRDFGENYVNELVAKRGEAPGATWHFIGRLQRNKAARVLEAADVVQTLEPGAAGERLAALAARRERTVRCLVEVDFTASRVGVRPEEAQGFLDRVSELEGVDVCGLMTVPPLGEPARPYFVRLRELRDRLREGHPGLVELSMGMSGDYEEAVEEGATMVRVGTAIFGSRPYGSA